MERARVTPVEGSTGLLAVLSLSLCICMLGMGIVNPLLPVYAVEMGAGGVFLGAIFSAFSVSRLIATFFSGHLADRISRRRLMIFGLSLYGLASVGYTVASAPWHLMLVRLINGIGSAFVAPVAMSIGAEVAPWGQEGRYFGTLQMAMFMGIGLGPILSGTMVERLGMRAPFITMTIMSVMALLSVAWRMPRGVGQGKRQESGMFESMVNILRDPVVNRVLAYQCVTAVGRGVSMLLIPVLAYERGLSLSQIGFVVAGLSISSALLQQVSGYIADRVPRHRLSVASCLLSAAGLVVLLDLQSFYSFLMAAIYYGGANAIGTPAALAMMTERMDRYGSGASMGAYNIAFGVGMASGPVLAGALQSRGLADLAFYGSALALVVVSTLFFKNPAPEVSSL